MDVLPESTSIKDTTEKSRTKTDNNHHIGRKPFSLLISQLFQELNQGKLISISIN